jgi:phosphoenolpyruvate---glycerone phosphotransferase subunit DhaK
MQGDVMNFDMAQEMAKMQDKNIETVLINDDIASSPKGLEDERRGTTADLLVIKIAGGAAESGADFERSASHYEKSCRFKQVPGRSACSLHNT